MLLWVETRVQRSMVNIHCANRTVSLRVYRLNPIAFMACLMSKAPRLPWHDQKRKPCWCKKTLPTRPACHGKRGALLIKRSEEHTSELQSRGHCICRLLLVTKIQNL